MNIAEFCKLNRGAVERLLCGHDVHKADDEEKTKRRRKRWPFPGTVELWVPDDEGIEEHQLATCLDLSVDGVGLLHDQELPIGLQLAIAIHQPEVSFHGQAVIRHCTEIDEGIFIGAQFLFDED